MAMYKYCPRCNRQLRIGETCPVCQAEWRAKHQRRYDTQKRDRRSARFYQSDAWRALRQYVLDKHHGLDMYVYATEGRVIPADAVHHILPIRDPGGWERRLDVRNLIPLSTATHSKIEDVYSRSEESKRRMMEQLKSIISKA